jgi:hypothetical protein
MWFCLKRFLNLPCSAVHCNPSTASGGVRDRKAVSFSHAAILCRVFLADGESLRVLSGATSLFMLIAMCTPLHR